MRALLLAAALLDGMDDPSRWAAVASDGVTAHVRAAEGCRGRGLRLDYDFGGGSGYAVARRPLALALPAGFALSFCLRAEGAANDLELKLVDESGANVWWWRKKGLAPSPDYQRVTVKRRHLTFAWGPAGAAAGLHGMAALEIAIVAGEGGRGSLFFDELELEERAPPAETGPPALSASSSATGFGAARALDGSLETSWRSERPAWLSLDFGGERELGGAVVTFERGREPRDYRLEVSGDGKAWRAVREVKGNGRTVSWLAFPETDARHLRLAFDQPAGVAEVEPRPPSFSESPNAFVLELAKRSPRGRFPRGFSGQQTYWTVAGVDGAAEEVLVGEDGALEPGKGTFSLEPFLLVGGRLLDWSRVRASHSLEEGTLPIPTVTWTAGPLELAITALADGPLRARYRLRNHDSQPAATRLLVTIRPFLVNPPSQFLNAPHGVSPISSLTISRRAAAVLGRSVVATPPASAAGATTSDGADLVELLSTGALPGAASVEDPTGLASGAFAWDLTVPPGGSRDVELLVPLGGGSEEAGDFEGRLQAAVAAWKEKLDRVRFRLPPAAEPLAATLRSNLAYVLVNRDGPRIQPGSRAYERSWIRDGALTSSALLRLGHQDAVREFLVWFASHQFESGKVPCCVDARGADPVPEHDSHGQLLFLATEYHRFTGDAATIAGLWPRIEKTVAYIDALRQQRRTPEYQEPAKRAFYGLLPESISHEGYSDRPVHSYWDDFFALKGLKDAVELARALGRDAQAAGWGRIRDELRTDLLASMRATIAEHRLDTLPASVERHDFDPTSTTAILSPGGEMASLPQRELRRTFERYLLESRGRRDGTRKSDAYTPYELRSVGALLRLGLKAEAHEMLAFFMDDRRPAGWNQWAEVVGADPREPRFLGDMPHTWVGTDFIRSFLDFFAYERDDGSYLLAAGLPEAWVRAPLGVAVSGLRTPHGALELDVRAEGGQLHASVLGLALPPGGLALAWPLPGSPRTATVNGKPAEIRGGEILVREVPARIVAGQ